MERNQTTIAAVNHQRAMRIKFCNHFSRQSMKKTGRCREVILASKVWTLFSGRTVAVVERFMNKSMDCPSTGTKKWPLRRGGH